MSGLFGFANSDSQATDNRIAATDDARVAEGAQANEGSVVLAPGKKGAATYVSPNSVNVSGSNINDTRNQGLLIDSQARVGNITINDTAAIATLAGQFSEAVSQLATQTTEVLGNLVKNFQASAIAPTDSSLASQIAATPVDDTVTKPKTSVWMILAGLGGLFGVYYFFFRK